MKPLKKGTFGCLLLLFLAAFAAGQEQERQYEDKTQSPYFFVQGDPAVDQLPLKSTNVNIAISGVIADVRVVQTYRNQGRRPINATYMFPASTRAAVFDANADRKPGHSRKDQAARGGETGVREGQAGGQERVAA